MVTTETTTMDRVAHKIAVGREATVHSRDALESDQIRAQRMAEWRREPHPDLSDEEIALAERALGRPIDPTELGDLRAWVREELRGGRGDELRVG